MKEEFDPETQSGFSQTRRKSKERFCHNAKELLCVGLHWPVPFIEDLSRTVQVFW